MKVVEDAADAVELNFDVLVGVDLVRGLRRPLHYRLEHPPYLSHALLYVLGTAFCASSGQVLRGGHRCAIALALHEITSGWIRAVGFLRLYLLLEVQDLVVRDTADQLDLESINVEEDLEDQMLAEGLVDALLSYIGAGVLEIRSLLEGFL